MKNIEITVKGMVCSGCENRVCNVLQNIEGIEKVTASYKDECVRITFNDTLDLNQIKNKIEDIGFTVVEKN